MYSGTFIPAPCVIEGGGGLSTICGFCFVKREKKLAHISILFFIVNPYKFRFFYLENRVNFTLCKRNFSKDMIRSATQNISTKESMRVYGTICLQGKMR